MKQHKKSLATLILLAITLTLCMTACQENSTDNSSNSATGTSQSETDQGATQQDKATYICITMDEAKELMASESDYIILDVRTDAEFAEGHIPGAICIPNETINDTEPDQLPDKEQLILIYCRSGNRSKQASAKLAELGYTNIKEFGGIIDWDGDIEIDVNK